MATVQLTLSSYLLLVSPHLQAPVFVICVISFCIPGTVHSPGKAAFFCVCFFSSVHCISDFRYWLQILGTNCVPRDAV